MARMLLLKVWAIDEFGDAAPSSSTLHYYAKHNMIFPPPKKVGRKWMVEQDARFIGMISEPTINKSDNPLLKRILLDVR
ncbi:excisionase [Pectobacterium carotovorum subsp. carotovorum]|uniref:excisionase n=1 Tax=Pectobacterium versatile TaxID=2488639 RepID=UPI00203111C1|nr:excisionase [Pectobacterium carotovorum]MCL6401859.1 excisionase [Pectobacterium carotovorum subsp. carotovorum]